MKLWPPSVGDGKFELLKDHFQWLERRQQWLPVGSNCVPQQPNQCPAIVLGQVEGDSAANGSQQVI